jgi:hypothetical protein
MWNHRAPENKRVASLEAKVTPRAWSNRIASSAEQGRPLFQFPGVIWRGVETNFCHS